MSDPKVSIDRRTKRFCIMDGFKFIGDFQPYETEADAITAAQAHFGPEAKVEAVYPSVSKITYTCEKRRKK